MAQVAKTLPQSARLPEQKSQRDWGSSVKQSGSGLPSRTIVHGVEGVGKTSFAAAAPKPFFLMARGETGLETLIDAKRTTEIPHFPELMTWEDTMSALQWIHDQASVGFETLVTDTLNGFERLCHEHVCATEYRNEWGAKGFGSYQQGFEVSLASWRELLGMFDKIREKHRMRIICLIHTKVGPFRNPEGADYDRYSPDMHHKTWGLTHKWADTVLFMNYFMTVSDDGKGQGGQQRVIYATKHAAHDAKNRIGLPDMIQMGSSGQSAWKAFRDASVAAFNSNTQEQEGEVNNG